VAAVSDAAGSKGRVSALAAGMATIRAQYMTVAGSTVVTVSAATLTSITVSPAAATVPAGGIASFTASGSFDDGSTLDVTDVVTWTSSDTGVADISNAAGTRGQATGFAMGSVKISAQRGTVIGTAALTVN
jgi:hypothetical protein